MNTCPVCLYGSLPYPPRDYHICPCCGTEFGNDDARFTHEQLREAWIAGGARWFFGRPPEHWNPWVQLLVAGYVGVSPQFEIKSLETKTSTGITTNQEFQLALVA
jgi:hypothetical protein